MSRPDVTVLLYQKKMLWLKCHVQTDKVWGRDFERYQQDISWRVQDSHFPPPHPELPVLNHARFLWNQWISNMLLFLLQGHGSVNCWLPWFPVIEGLTCAAAVTIGFGQVKVRAHALVTTTSHVHTHIYKPTNCQFFYDNDNTQQKLHFHIWGFEVN